MLVLTRRKEEKVLFFLPDGSSIELVLIGIRGDQVRLGFDAPPNVGILRAELWVQKDLAKQSAWVKQFRYPLLLRWVIARTLALRRIGRRRTLPAKTVDRTCTEGRC